MSMQGRGFLAAPELSRRQFRMETVSQLTEHHDLSPSEVSREHSAVDKMKAVTIAHGNPFAVERDRLHNIITHAYVPDEFVEQILNANDTGHKIYEDCVTERINGNICLWAKVTKVGNKMFMSGNKTTTIKLRDKTVDLKETKDLYGRLMILAKSTRDIDQKGAIGNHDFTLTPRSLFSPDGPMLRRKGKSKLIRFLEMLGKEAELEQGLLLSGETGCVCEGSMDEYATHVLPTESRDVERERGIAVVDGMVILNKMQSTVLGTVVDLSHSFNYLLLSMTRGYDDIILVFDTYNDVSLKCATREALLQGQRPVQYQIHEETRIKHITMKRFLSHDKINADIADYLAMKVLTYNTDSL